MINRLYLTILQSLQIVSQFLTLSVLFFFVLSPYAVIMRRFRRHPAFATTDLETYWLKPSKVKPVDFDKQF